MASSSADAADVAAVDYTALIPQHQLDAIIRRWIELDTPSGFDVGGFVVGAATTRKQATLYMKSDGVLAGKLFFDAVFRVLGCHVDWTAAPTSEGDDIVVTKQAKIALATVTGPCHAILQGERTALNILSRCSGVATAARRARDQARSKCPHWTGQVAGTRKTTPGDFRLVEKYGLLVGGCATHRLDLSQMVMLKDNHIWACDGDIAKAVQTARRAAGFSQKIEVECQSLDEAIQAASAGADIVMLDNFSPSQLKKDAATFKQQYPHVIVEASGGITLETLAEYVSEDVDVISQGCLTHGYSCIDYSLKIAK